MKTIRIIQGDITELKVDAIVNAANSSLLGGSGVDGAIHRKGGAEILTECQQIRARQGGCAVGEAVITHAGLLPAQYVIHAVGPIWRNGMYDEDQFLANAYRHSLELAESKQLHSLAFPNISTGVYGFPKARAVNIALATVIDFLKTSIQVTEVIFVCFDQENYQLYQQESLNHAKQQSDLRLL